MDLNVIEPVREAIKHFETKEEFNQFYKLHKEKLDQITTHKLNKMYSIDGYHITRIKSHEGLSLKKWEGSSYMSNLYKTKIDDAYERLSYIEANYTKLDGVLKRFETDHTKLEDMLKRFEVVQDLFGQFRQISDDVMFVKTELDKFKHAYRELTKELKENKVIYQDVTKRLPMKGYYDEL
jgi:DNA repair ATPase RecN